MVLDFAPKSLDSVLALLDNMTAKRTWCEETLRVLNIRLKKKKIQAREEKEVKARKEADIRAKQKEVASVRAAEAERWIEDHGSAQLKAIIKDGYECDRMYHFERAAYRYPGFVLDYDERADWNKQSCPSVEALRKARNIEAQHQDAKVTVVWLTQPVWNEEIETDDGLGEYQMAAYDFVPCEAIVIRDRVFDCGLVLTDLQ